MRLMLLLPGHWFFLLRAVRHSCFTESEYSRGLNEYCSDLCHINAYLLVNYYALYVCACMHHNCVSDFGFDCITITDGIIVVLIGIML